MDANLIDKVKKELKWYEQRIDEIDSNYDKLEILGRYDPASPYIEKYVISFIITYLAKNGFEISGINKEQEKLNNKLRTLELKRGRDYRDKLYEKLKSQVNRYPKMICCTFDLDPVCLETENALDGRDVLEILMMELKNEYELQPLEEKTSSLDEVFKLKYARHIRAYLKECPSIEKPYYPDNFWWRHPSEFLESRKYGL